MLDARIADAFRSHVANHGSRRAKAAITDIADISTETARHGGRFAGDDVDLHARACMDLLGTSRSR
jgi:hypothetical protein